MHYKPDNMKNIREHAINKRKNATVGLVWFAFMGELEFPNLFI